jgi:hypothetical protein
MKKVTILTLVAILAMLFAAVGPASAQLGQTDFSSFTVQNVDTVAADVTVYFYNDAGVEFIPNPLNGAQPNPFTLDPGEAFEIYVPGIAVGELPNGRYSVMIESSARVVTIANLIGSGTVNFNGSYSGFSESAPTFYLPGVVFNFYGWYSLVSVQNVSATPADITLTITCEGGAVGTLTAADVPQFASHHFVLKDTTPSGFTAATVCNGSAMISGGGANIVVTDNQSVPTAGNTQSYSGVAAGTPTVFIPALYHSYYGWDASINVQKLGAGATTITATYSDGGTSTCDLTDVAPACLLYMPNEHPGTGYFGATITNSTGLDLMVIANAANGSQAQTYNGIGGGTGAVGVPSVMKDYYDWNTSFTCQNIGSVATTLEVLYDGYAANAYDTASLAEGETIEVYTPGEAFLPAGHVGGATVTANAAGAEITCIVNFNNPAMMGSTVGDWSMSYNAFNK